MSQPYYEPPFRPPYEYGVAITWTVAGFGTLLTSLVFGVPASAALVAAFGAWAMAWWRYRQGRPHAEARRRLRTADALWFMSVERAERWYAWSAYHGKLWLGLGYELTASSAEKIKLVAERGLDEYMGVELEDGAKGVGWVQQVEHNDPVQLDLGQLSGHALVVGTTRTGKTRLFDHLLGQAIRRGEPVIAFDPKGDHDLEAQMRAAYDRLGCPEKFAAFRPAHPEESVRIDPLGNWSRSTEVASRVSALVEADGTFLAFVWRVLNNLVQGELMVGRKPNLITLRRLVEHGAERLVLEALKTWCQQHAKPEEYAGYVNNARTKKGGDGGELEGYMQFYDTVLIKRAPSLAVEGLIADVRHNKEHFSKMVVSLTPILTMLSTAPLDELLSPEPRPGDDREILTLNKVVQQGRGLYVSLSSMADPVVGSAIGSMLLADLAAYTGSRHDSGITRPVINLLGDEIAEITNAQLTQLMNKGGGAGLRTIIATQTLADLEARLGSEAKALQQIGNANNVIVLRVQDPKTAELLSKGLPQFKARSVNRSHSQSLQAEPHSVWNGSYGESLQQETAPLITPDLLMRLPPLHYVARFSDGRVVKGQFPIVGESKK